MKEIALSINWNSIDFDTTIERLEKLEEKLKLPGDVILPHESSSLCIEYFVKPVLHQFFSSLSWDNFSNQWARLEDSIENRPLQTNENNDTLDDDQL